MDSIKELEKAIDAKVIKKAGKLMLKEVAPIVEEILAATIEEEVYGFHYPFDSGKYTRRHQLPEMLVSCMIDSTTMFTTSTAPPAPSLLPKYRRTRAWDGRKATGPKVGGTGSASRKISGFTNYTVNAGVGGFLAFLEAGDMGFITNAHGGELFPRPVVPIAQDKVDGSASVKAALQRVAKKALES